MKQHKSEEAYTIHFDGAAIRVTESQYTYELLIKDTEGDYRLQIEAPVLVDGEGHGPRELSLGAPILHGMLQNARAKTIVMTVDGTLRLVLEELPALVVKGNGKFEPWNLHGPNGLFIVSGPGKELTIWGDLNT